MGKKYEVLPLMGIALAVVSCGVLLDAAFQLSKFSFLSKSTGWELFAVIINSLALLLLPVLIVLGTVNILFRAFRNYAQVCRFLRSAVLLVLSLLFVAVAFTHIDTWIYTTFNKGVGSLPSAVNVGLLLLMAAAGYLLSKKKGERIYLAFAGYKRLIVFLFVLIFVLSGILSVTTMVAKFPHLKGTTKVKRTGGPLPNIFLFAADSLDNSHLDIYGYERKTTKFIELLANVGIVYNRAYSNSRWSRGSVASLLTGKLPTTTKVNYPPDVLQGEDAFQHLPGILADLGYFNIDMGDDLHVSSSKTNMQVGFHMENSKRTKFGSYNVVVMRFKRLFNMELFFISETLERILNRVGYMAGFSERLVLFQRIMDNFKGLHPIPEYWFEDQNLRNLFAVIRETDRPMFAHIHILRTHGPLYKGLYERRFSANKEIPEGFDVDFYDDAILTVDYILGKLLDVLKKAGKLENSLIIFHSDHPLGNVVNKAMPLVVHLPGQSEKRVVEAPVQYLDIAPSILYYLGVEVPEWMEGTPIFPDVDEDALMKRPIFTASCNTECLDGGARILRKFLQPPIYGFGSTSVIIGDYLYSYHIETEESTMYDISTDPSDPREISDKQKEMQYRQILFSHLLSKGIETSVRKAFGNRLQRRR
jgi:hypothetical protein